MTEISSSKKPRPAGASAEKPASQQDSYTHTAIARHSARFAVVVGAITAGALAWVVDEPSKRYSVLVLCISVVFELTLCWSTARYPKWLAYVPATLEICKTLSLIAYFAKPHLVGAYLCLGFASFAILYTGWMAWQALWQKEVPDHVFVIWVMFIIFLHVMYLCAFAVGIYNKVENESALLRANAKEEFQRNVPGEQERTACFAARFEDSCPSTNAELGCMTEADLIALATDDGVRSVVSSRVEEGADLREMRRVLALERSKLPPSEARSTVTYHDPTLRIARDTIANLVLLDEKVKVLCSPKDQKRTNVTDRPICRLTVFSHATDDLPAGDPGAKKANDQLAWQRAVCMFHVAEKMFGGTDIEYTLVSGSNRDYVLCGGNITGRRDGVDHKLFTEIRLETLSTTPLSLMDYLYFMTYTVSTTGYGDLIPAKPFVQLVVSIANLWEIFFVVICLNVILDAKRAKSSPGEKPPPASG